MHIKPVDRTIRTLLESGFYKIPRFQRPYSWDKDNVDDLWSDAIASDDPDYFIGSFVLYKEREHSDTFMVVDGQQRLTTLTILLAAVRNALDALGATRLGAGIQNLIERQNIDNETHYVLQTETSYPYLHEHIQKHGQPALPAGNGSEEDAIKLAFDHLTTKVSDTVTAVDGDPSISARRKEKVKQDRLLAIRDKVLRLQLITVELTNEDDAYLIFETLNTRGKDLGVADMVKNLFTRLLRPTNRGVDVAKDKWNSIRDLFDASDANLDLNAFIYHSWLSRDKYIGRERLFKEMKELVNRASAMAFLDHLVADAFLYRQVLEPSSHRWPRQESAVAASFEALNIFKVMQPVPMTLAILREYRTRGLTLGQARSILREMENFHVQFTAVTAQRTGGGTARMYAAAAQALHEARDKNARAQVLADFKNKMRGRVPLFQEFDANFGEIEFLSDNTKQKALVQYLLRRYDNHGRSGAPVNYSAMSIEHIAPENPAPGTTRPSNAGRLGNLLLLPDQMNVELGNAEFNVKVAAYRQAGVPLDPVLESATSWGEQEIAARTAYLARLGYEKVFKV